MYTSWVRMFRQLDQQNEPAGDGKLLGRADWREASEKGQARQWS